MCIRARSENIALAIAFGAIKLALALIYAEYAAILPIPPAGPSAVHAHIMQNIGKWLDVSVVRHIVRRA